MTQITGAVNLTGMIAPTDTDDVYPTHASIYAKGGYREVADQTERDNIPAPRRTHGMLVYQQSDQTVYQLGAGLTNLDWTEFNVKSDAINIGTGAFVLDNSDPDQDKFRSFVQGSNNDITITVVGDEIVIDTAQKINSLEYNSFTGTGSNSVYILPYTVTQDWHVIVHIDGAAQTPTTAYTISGNTLTLASPLPLNSVMTVHKLASLTTSTSITDADTLDAQHGSYYLDYNNFTNTPTNHMVNDATNTVSGSINPSVDATYDLGTPTEQWNVIYGHTVEATYADLAERYSADAPYEPGTVLVFGGEAEVTTTTKIADRAVAGVISTEPAYLMNSKAGNSQTHPAIALKGRVPCKVVGVVKKGDLLVTSNVPGHAKAALDSEILVGTVIGKAIEDKSGVAPGIVEVFVSMM